MRIYFYTSRSRRRRILIPRKSRRHFLLSGYADSGASSQGSGHAPGPLQIIRGYRQRQRFWQITWGASAKDRICHIEFVTRKQGDLDAIPSIVPYVFSRHGTYSAGNGSASHRRQR
ncbi:protein of unknown function [Candidatus Methylocalor cossyra]|uniref:Uncharacterized protein n=1 Tax=Candidatus Methylocalor cossyra TaxID=3108543 RepID=A0ABM9NFM5_9GAMM